MNNLVRKIRKLIRHHTHIAIYGFSIICCVLFCIFVLYPTLKNILIMKSQLKVLNQDISLMSTKQATLDTYDETTLQSHLDSLYNAIPDRKSPVLIFQTMDNLQSKSGVRMGTIDIPAPGQIASSSATKQESKTKNVASAVPISTSVNGNMDQILDFLSTIQHVKPLLSSEDVSFSYNALESSESAEIRANLTINNYYINPPKVNVQAMTPIKLFTDSDIVLLSEVSNIPEFSQDIIPMSQLYSPDRNPFISY